MAKSSYRNYAAFVENSHLVHSKDFRSFLYIYIYIPESSCVCVCLDPFCVGKTAGDYSVAEGLPTASCFNNYKTCDSLLQVTDKNCGVSSTGAYFNAITRTCMNAQPSTTCPSKQKPKFLRRCNHIHRLSPKTFARVVVVLIN